MTRAVSFTLNGQPVAMEPASGESLLDALRERFGVVSIKDGCQPQGQCGCCLALIDGRPLVTCAFEARRAEGRDVLTLEGVSAREREVVSRALAAAGGVQCGFCIPGIALRAKHLLDRQAAPSRDEITRAIDLHLCRCTGYTQIVEAVELMARVWRGGEMPALLDDGGVGKPLARYGALGQALGARPYVADCSAGPLHGALPGARRARVLSIDTTKAAPLPGVRAGDCRGRAWRAGTGCSRTTGRASWPRARRVLRGRRSPPCGRRRTDCTRGGPWRSSTNVPPVLDPDAALAPGAPQVNPKHPNLLSRSVIRRGDAAAALSASAHVVTGTWQTQRIEHLFLEPEAALAEPLPDGRLGLYSQGQGVFDDRRQVARFLGVPDEQVHV
jgi:xanthine dehydrogenase molybdenum-binding subunit